MLGNGSTKGAVGTLSRSICRPRVLAAPLAPKKGTATRPTAPSGGRRFLRSDRSLSERLA